MRVALRMVLRPHQSAKRILRLAILFLAFCVPLGLSVTAEASIDSPEASLGAGSRSFELRRKVEFNGGAIVDIAAADADSVLILTGMPEGFSVFRLWADGGRSEKYLSSSYLMSLAGTSARGQDWRLRFDPSSGLLAILPRKKGSPLLLDMSNAPSLKRFRLGLPSQFEVGGVSFLSGGEMVLYSRPFAGTDGGSQLVVFDPNAASLRRLQIQRPLGVILQLSALSEKRLMARGYFSTDGAEATPMLATISLDDGAVDLWDGSEGTILLGGAKGTVAAVRPRASAVGPADEGGAPRELVVLAERGEPLPHTQPVPIYEKPRALSLSDSGFYVLLLSGNQQDFGDLWLVDTRSRGKWLVAEQVMHFGMLPHSAGFYLQPARENAVYFYRLKSVEGDES